MTKFQSGVYPKRENNDRFTVSVQLLYNSARMLEIKKICSHTFKNIAVPFVEIPYKPVEESDPCY